MTDQLIWFVLKVLNTGIAYGFLDYRNQWRSNAERSYTALQEPGNLLRSPRKLAAYGEGYIWYVIMCHSQQSEYGIRSIADEAPPLFSRNIGLYVTISWDAQSMAFKKLEKQEYISYNSSMKYLSRIIEQKVRELGQFFQVVVVTGARQVGKSTLFEHLHLSPSTPIVFDSVLDIRNVRQDPDLFLRNISLPAVLDEIQYAPELISAIKRYIDARKDEKGLFYVTGSQQFSVLKNVSESLAGRAAYLELFPFCLAEKYEMSSSRQLLEMICTHIDNGGLQHNGSALHKIVPDALPLFQELWRGYYPGTLVIPDEYLHAWYESYLRTYIERDVRLLGEVRDEHLFSRFFQLLSALSAQEINYSQLGRELGIDPKTAQAWLTILEHSYQWISLPAYSPNIIKRISRKPKGYLTDTGFICYLQRIGSADVLSASPILGSVFETFVVCEMVKQMQRMPFKPNLYHWRAHSGAEVDLVIEYNGIFHLVEIKLKTNPSLRDAQGFLSFRKTYPDLRYGSCWLVCAVDEPYQMDERTHIFPYDYVI